MCLAYTGRAQQEQAAIDDRKRISEALRVPERLLEFVVVRLELSEIAPLIAAGDARRRHQRVAHLRAPAIAARDTTNTVDLDRLPAGVVTQ